MVGADKELPIFLADMNHEIGIGLIGAGDISLYHSQGIRACKETKLVGFYDVLSERAQQKAKEFGGNEEISS